MWGINKKMFHIDNALLNTYTLECLPASFSVIIPLSHRPIPHNSTAWWISRGFQIKWLKNLPRLLGNAFLFRLFLMVICLEDRVDLVPLGPFTFPWSLHFTSRNNINASTYSDWSFLLHEKDIVYGFVRYWWPSGLAYGRRCFLESDSLGKSVKTSV